MRVQPDSSVRRFRLVRPTWTNIANWVLLTGLVWALFVFALVADPRTCYPELCKPAEGHEWIRLSSEVRIPVLDRRVDADGDLWIVYVSAAESRDFEAICTEARQVSAVVTRDVRHHDARRVYLGMTFPDGVSWRVGKFHECCTTVYFSSVRNDRGEWHVRQCS